jgi:signal transduction histidine kinase
VVAIALVVASLAMLTLLRSDLSRAAEQHSLQQAAAVAKLASNGQLTKRAPLGNGTDFVQVLGADGQVVAASPNVAGRKGPVVHPGAASGAVRTKRDLAALGIDPDQQIASVSVATPKGPMIVQAGVPLGPVDDAESTTALILAVGCPLLLLTVGLLTWLVTSRALRPVESIRTEVAAIGEQELHRRVPMPRGEDEIARLAATMNSMLNRLDAAGRRQHQFIADASHELRSPIAVLRTQLEVALTHSDPSVRTELVAGALQDAERLQDLAADLLFLARLDSGPDQAPQADPDVDLSGLVERTVREHGAQRCATALELQRDVRVAGNRIWLTRLVTNLLNNAQRHARTTVTVRLHAPNASCVRPGGGTGVAAAQPDHSAAHAGPPEAVLEVHNDGDPINPADRLRIFERFTRLDDARSRDLGGAGLGLPIARDIARHHGGTLEVVDSPEGATFQVRLPTVPG